MEHSYPELARRKLLLQRVDDFCRNRANANQGLRQEDIADNNEDGNLFLILAEEGYIDVQNITPSSKTDHRAFALAVVRGLHSSGQQLLGELPDPTEAVIERLDDIETAIYELEGVSEEERKKGIDAAEEMKHFARALPPGFALQVFGNLFQ